MGKIHLLEIILTFFETVTEKKFDFKNIKSGIVWEYQLNLGRRKTILPTVRKFQKKFVK